MYKLIDSKGNTVFSSSLHKNCVRELKTRLPASDDPYRQEGFDIDTGLAIVDTVTVNGSPFTNTEEANTMVRRIAKRRESVRFVNAQGKEVEEDQAVGVVFPYPEPFRSMSDFYELMHVLETPDYDDRKITITVVWSDGTQYSCKVFARDVSIEENEGQGFDALRHVKNQLSTIARGGVNMDEAQLILNTCSLVDPGKIRFSHLKMQEV